jgi:heme/copper-type cytochrome/quinol oxidase subunit 2
MEQIYSNSIEFGRFYTYLMFLIALVVALIMLWWAWRIRNQNAKYRGVAKGSIMDAACEALNKDLMSCAVDARYEVDDTNYSVTNFNVKTPTALKKGDKVKMNFNIANPSDIISAADLIPNSWSTTLVYVAILIVLVAIFKLWLTRKYNFAAAGSAVSGIMTTFKV